MSDDRLKHEQAEYIRTMREDLELRNRQRAIWNRENAGKQNNELFLIFVIIAGVIMCVLSICIVITILAVVNAPK